MGSASAGPAYVAPAERMNWKGADVDPHARAAAVVGTPTVLVLGATGFIGQALVRRLCQAGLGTRALVRVDSARSNTLAAQGVELVTGDLADRAVLDAALAGIEHVYHLARGAGSTWDDYLRTDVGPTRQLAEMCAARGAWLYYTSSIAIYDGGRDGDVIDESTPASPHALQVNAYARAKAENEKLIAALHRERGLKAVIFRPGIVIGAGGSLHPAGVGAWPSDTLCRPWGGGGQRLPFVLVDDCADAMLRASQVDGLAGESFNLVGDAPLTGNEYLDALERAAGITIRRAPMPPWWLYTRGIAKWGALKMLGRTSSAAPSRRYFEGLIRRGSFSAQHAKLRLGWSPNADVSVLIDNGIRAAATALPAGASR
jgi:nucleoside-diphosphate-sugar epimerase